MKLTIIQITLLREATREAVHAYTVKAEAAKEAQPALERYWLNEAAEARQLVHILTDALCIEVESASLEPATPSTAAAVEQNLDRLHQVESTLLRPVQKRARAKRPPAASPEPAVSSGVHATGPASEGPSSCQPHSGEGKSTSDPLPSDPATHDPETSAGTSHQSSHGTTPHAPERPLASGLQDNSNPPATHAASPQSPDLATPKKHSSAHHGSACGDINCDGQCHVARAEKPAHPPALIQLIDVSPTENDARIATANATTAALRAAARFLRTDMHSLPAVIKRRVRERLAKAAA